MNTTRLLLLADFLDTVPGHKFDLMTWRNNDTGEMSDANLLDHNCRTTGCAVGWACAMPEFQEQGLCWGGFRPVFDAGKLMPYYIGWDAVEMFFNIGSETSDHLFDDERYDGVATPKDVANRIRELVT